MLSVIPRSGETTGAAYVAYVQTGHRGMSNNRQRYGVFGVKGAVPSVGLCALVSGNASGQPGGQELTMVTGCRYASRHSGILALRLSRVLGLVAGGGS